MGRSSQRIGLLGQRRGPMAKSTAPGDQNSPSPGSERVRGTGRLPVPVVGVESNFRRQRGSKYLHWSASLGERDGGRPVLASLRNGQPGD